ncbi:MAG: hypothetical protein ACFFDN_22130 [Candidatus Hodarchaeota archaeon]
MPFLSSSAFHTVPIYPYLDTHVFNAYLKLSYSQLKNQFAHRSFIQFINPELSNFPRYGLPIKIKYLDSLNWLIRIAYIIRAFGKRYKKYYYSPSFNSKILEEPFFMSIYEIGLFDTAFLREILNDSSANISRNSLERLLALSLFKKVYIDKKIPSNPEFKSVLNIFGFKT